MSKRKQEPPKKRWVVDVELVRESADADEAGKFYWAPLTQPATIREALRLRKALEDTLTAEGWRFQLRAETAPGAA